MSKLWPNNDLKKKNGSKMTHRASYGVEIQIQFELSYKGYLPNPDVLSHFPQASPLIAALALGIS